MQTFLKISDLSVGYTTKECFSNFSVNICYGDRVTIIGKNGSGKSSLLNKIYELAIKNKLKVSYIKQVSETDNSISGGEAFLLNFTNAISTYPDILLLDEPTNHLDNKNRNNLLRFLDNYYGTVIIVTHDRSLINNCEYIWHIYNSKVNKFHGSYSDYLTEQEIKKQTIETRIKEISEEKKRLHEKLMQEQERSSKMSLRGKKNIKNKKWATIKSATKLGNSIVTSNKIKKELFKENKKIETERKELYIPEDLKVSFSLKNNQKLDKDILVLKDLKIYYKEGLNVLESINFYMRGDEKVIITGDNASGKTTFIKMLLEDPSVRVKGEKLISNLSIGYLDQNYINLNKDKTVIEQFEKFDLIQIDIRKHLSQFLFRRNEEVNLCVNQLSGGEMCRLSLALIALEKNDLLLIDEPSNNIDLETKEQLINILNDFKGSFILVSHDEEFLNNINMDSIYKIENKTIKKVQ
ncbi:ATP-binding cassette domain-containing protein [Francisella frigiditurris]|uniref:Miro-like family protein n=1 Tax=Francisella frigiditurris TaxID=1542390 RepID=A0A1J0KVH2_9GAMM|nr:ATP-binding cassette domain-containing protein [Francisella frigiditurris]APC97687.1 miro-like family protein [Francisella frigiditurris]